MRRLLSVLFLTGLLGCGEDSDPALAFVGTWAYTSGTTTITCDDGSSDTQVRTGTVQIEHGTDAALTVTLVGPCVVRFDIVGGIATARAGQTCADASMGTAVSATYTNWTFKAEGTGLTEAKGANLTVTDATGTNKCTASGMGTLARQ